MGSLPIVAQGYVNKVSDVTAEISSPSNDVISAALPSTDVATTGNTSQLLPSLMYVPQSEIKKCDNCTFETISAEELIDHLANTHKATCSKCEKTFNSITDLQTHIASVHKISCSICKVECSDAEDIRIHTNKHHRIECSLCTDLFETGKDLDKDNWKAQTTHRTKPRTFT